MKKLLTVIFAAGLALPIYATEPAQTETKRVCMDQKDKDGAVIKNKDGSVKQVCREIKVHQKHEGTKIPDKK